MSVTLSSYSAVTFVMASRRGCNTVSRGFRRALGVFIRH